MHAHCEGRTIADLTAWAASQGYERTTAEDFADIKPLPDATPEEADEWAKLREILMRYMDPKTGSIQANLVSVAVGLQMGLEYCGFEIRQDTFTSMPVFRRAKAEPWQQLRNRRKSDGGGAPIKQLVLPHLERVENCVERPHIDFNNHLLWGYCFER